MRSILIVVFSLMGILMLPFQTEGKKVTTRLTAPKEKPAVKEKHKITSKSGEEFEEVASKLVFLGYDKKTSSAMESFFVENNSTESIKNLEIEISYFSLEGKQLHKRIVTIDRSFPHGETRQVDIKSWDRQKSFHYEHSTASKNGSTPYRVRFKVMSFEKYSSF